MYKISKNFNELAKYLADLVNSSLLTLSFLNTSRMILAGGKALNKILGFNRNKLLLCGPTSTRLFENKSLSGGMSKPESYELRHQVESEKQYSSKWKTYRILSVGLLGSCVGCFVMPGNPVVDFFTVTLLVHHNHFGINSVIADYAPLFLSKFGVNLLRYIWLSISIVTLALLLSFNYNGAGFSNSVSGFFKL